MTFLTYRLRRAHRLHRGPKASAPSRLASLPHECGQSKLELLLLVALAAFLLLFMVNRL